MSCGERQHLLWCGAPVWCQPSCCLLPLCPQPQQLGEAILGSLSRFHPQDWGPKGAGKLRFQNLGPALSSFTSCSSALGFHITSSTSDGLSSWKHLLMALCPHPLNSKQLAEYKHPHDWVSETEGQHCTWEGRRWRGAFPPQPTMWTRSGAPRLNSSWGNRCRVKLLVQLRAQVCAAW